MATDDPGEAHYLCAALNSAAIDSALGPLRRGDQAAHPNVHKKIFDVAPIPRYDPQNPRHRDLARLGSECAARISSRLSEDASLQGSLVAARRHARGLLAEELSEIAALTEELIGLPPRKT
jgi:hypothetical protein